MLPRKVRRLRWMISSSPSAAGAADPRPDGSTGSGAWLPTTRGVDGEGTGGGAKDCVGSATP
eukprot:12320931-Prorocentrum_lima.AAC.1